MTTGIELKPPGDAGASYTFSGVAFTTLTLPASRAAATRKYHVGGTLRSTNWRRQPVACRTRNGRPRAGVDSSNPFRSYCVTPAWLPQRRCPTLNRPCLNLPIRVPCTWPIPDPFLSVAPALGFTENGRKCAAFGLPTADLEEGSSRLPSPRLKSEAVFRVALKEAGTAIRDARAARFGCQTAAKRLDPAWTTRARTSGVYGVYGFWHGRLPVLEKDFLVATPTSEIRGRVPCSAGRDRQALGLCLAPVLQVSRAHVGVYGSVRILAKPSADLGEGALHVATRVRKCQAAFLTIGGRNRHHDTRRESSPNGPSDPGQWLAPFLHVSRAHVGVCGSVRILSTDILEGEAARRAVEGEQEPVYVEGKVVRRQARKKHGLTSFTIRSLRQRCDRLKGERLLGEFEPQSVESPQIGWFGELLSTSWGREPWPWPFGRNSDRCVTLPGPFYNGRTCVL